MTTPSKPAPTFPTNYEWVSSGALQYRPRKCDRDIYRRLCEAYMKMDKAFVHLLRSCKDTWIVSIVLGHTSVHLNIYDPEVVDDPLQPDRSSALGDATFFEVNRLMEFDRMSVARIERTKRRHPMSYNNRILRPQEMKVLDSMQQALQLEAGDAIAQAVEAGPVSNLLQEIRDAEAEEPQINRTPLLAMRQPS